MAIFYLIFHLRFLKILLAKTEHVIVPILTCSSFSEFPLDDSSFDSIYNLNPDILRWTLSVQDVNTSGSDILPGSSDCLREESGHFEDQILSKDEDGSVTSSMDDSAYMSQSDTSRQAAPAGKRRSDQSSQDNRPQSYETFLYSPAMGAGNHPVFHGAPEMNHLIIPNQMVQPEQGGIGLNVAEFPNYATNHAYGRAMGYDISGQPMSSTFAQNNELVSGFGWTPTYGNTYPIGAVDESIFAQPIQAQQETGSQQHRNVHQSTSDEAASQHSQRRTSQSVRPRLQRMDGSMNSRLSDDTATSNISLNHDSVAANTSSRVPLPDQQMSSYGTSLLTSPTSRTASVGAIDVSTLPEYSKGLPNLSSISDETVGPDKNTEFYAQPDSGSGQNTAEDVEGKKARTHSLYQATPGKDELYHCPNEGTLGCTHKPTKLKCNYDKYVDSHLRPFRCKNSMCTGVQFSSTACLLRHEREAHGMHGHGNKPHLCTYEGCERSLPEHGFPRRYNLFDHMKRVHDFTGPASPSEKETPSQGQPVNKRQVNRKRKASTEMSERGEKKSKITITRESASSPPKPADKKLEISKLQEEWVQLRLYILATLHELKMQDVKQYQDISEKLLELQKLSERYALFEEQG